MWEKVQEQNWKDFTMRSMRQITRETGAAAPPSPQSAAGAGAAAVQSPSQQGSSSGGAGRRSRMPDDVVEWLQREGFFQCVMSGYCLCY